MNIINSKKFNKLVNIKEKNIVRNLVTKTIIILIKKKAYTKKKIFVEESKDLGKITTHQKKF